MGWVKFKNGATMVVEASWVLNYVGRGQHGAVRHQGRRGSCGGDTVRINGEKDGSLFVADVKPNSTARDLFHGQNLTPRGVRGQAVDLQRGEQHPAPDQARGGLRGVPHHRGHLRVRPHG